MNGINRQVVLVSRPDGASDVSNFLLRESSIPALSAGEVLVRSMYLSIDPWLRAVMNHHAFPPIETVVPGDVVGCVVESKNAVFRPGDIVQGLLGWQHYAVAPWYFLRKIDPNVAPISTALGVLGSSGRTAYFGLFDVGRIKPGETVVVSSAAGAVASIAVQLAKLAGCRVIGVAGSEEKICYMTRDLGLVAALNYRARSGDHNSPCTAPSVSICISTTWGVKSVTPSSRC